MNQESFERRHIGVNEKDVEHMLKSIGVKSINELISETIPNSILKKEPLLNLLLPNKIIYYP